MSINCYCIQLLPQLVEYWFTSSQVISKERIENGGNCMDANGIVYSHGDEWSEDGVCSKYTCFQVGLKAQTLVYFLWAALGLDDKILPNVPICGRIIFSYFHSGWFRSDFASFGVRKLRNTISKQSLLFSDFSSDLNSQNKQFVKEQ